EQGPQPGQLGLGQLGRAADLAPVEPEAATLRAEIDLQPLERRLVQDGVAFHAADVGCVRHGRDTSSPMSGTEQSTGTGSAGAETNAETGPPNAEAGPPNAETGLAALEARLGYVFRDRALAETALTHTSWLNEAAAPGRADNERLEFLGDAVLALVVSDLLMRRLPGSAEGDLTRARAALVSEGGLAGAAVDPGRCAGGAHGGHLPRQRARRGRGGDDAPVSDRARRRAGARAARLQVAPAGAGAGALAVGARLPGGRRERPRPRQAVRGGADVRRPRVGARRRPFEEGGRAERRGGGAGHAGARGEARTGPG